jgi:hypothetical protein
MQLMWVRVEPAAIRALSRRLGEATTVARDVRDQSSGLHHLLDDPGSDELAGSARRFIEEWSFGVGCLEADAAVLSRMLDQAGDAYVQLEGAVAAEFDGGARPR